MTLKPLWPLVRRLRALRALGITTATICTETGLDRIQVEMIIDFDYPETTPEVDKKIRELYERRQSDDYNPSEQDKHLIWPVPYDWDNIDNPAENPYPSRHNAEFPQLTGNRIDEHGIWRNGYSWGYCIRGHYHYPWNLGETPKGTLYCLACKAGHDLHRKFGGDREFLIAVEYRRLERQSHVQSA